MSKVQKQQRHCFGSQRGEGEAQERSVVLDLHRLVVGTLRMDLSDAAEADIRTVRQTQKDSIQDCHLRGLSGLRSQMESMIKRKACCITCNTLFSLKPFSNQQNTCCQLSCTDLPFQTVVILIQLTGLRPSYLQ